MESVRDITRTILILRGQRVLRDAELATHDETIAAMLCAIRELMKPPQPKRRGIGFTADLTNK